MSETKSITGSIITKADNDGNNTFWFQASTAAKDSYGDVVVQEGIDLKRFKKNPIILYQHRHDEPIGRAKTVQFGDKGLEVEVELAPDGVSQRIDAIKGLIKAGILKAVSIGFSSIEHEVMRDKENNFMGIKFLKSLLHEVSVVSVPANAQALAIAKSFGLSDEQKSELFSKDGEKVIPVETIHVRNQLEMLKMKPRVRG